MGGGAGRRHAGEALSVERLCMRPNGFTLIELLIAAGIAAILGALIISAQVQSSRARALTGSAEKIVTALYAAQSRSLTQEKGSSWGVRFSYTDSENPFFAIFEGPSYVTPASITYLPAAVDFTVPSQGATTDILFKKLSGTRDDEVSGDITVTLRLKNTALTESVTVSKAGLISRTASQ